MTHTSAPHRPDKATGARTTVPTRPPTRSNHVRTSQIGRLHAVAAPWHLGLSTSRMATWHDTDDAADDATESVGPVDGSFIEALPCVHRCARRCAPSNASEPSRIGCREGQTDGVDSTIALNFIRFGTLGRRGMLRRLPRPRRLSTPVDNDVDAAILLRAGVTAGTDLGGEG